MRTTLRLNAIILTKAQRAKVSIMSKGYIVACILPLRCFLFLLRNHIHVYAIVFIF